MPERGLPTPSAAIAGAARVLARAGVASPRVDAELLAAHVLGIPRARLLTAPRFATEQAAEFDRLVLLRATRVPLQHLTGEAPFFGFELLVGPGVFIPRFETELLVEWALRHPGRTVVDLCSGSGAIAIAVARARPDADVYAVEASAKALDWLRRNATRLAPSVRVVRGDATDPTVLSDVDGAADLVLCNPPYVPEDAPVDVEVRDHDPHEAVFGGRDGMDLMAGIARRAAALLRPGGVLAIEHDDTQGETLPALLREAGFTEVADHRDLAGRPRFTTARLPA
ncbi:peptide chain release factor N(5)-glutamine methyltransferase [Dactylosporangium roseum]|uniref:Release factor glutamine methyltransferase n=1 Tax=Dactylosporangium roseum TaxID=47989 RepID=A0ABY5ZHM1_9ACTN|nr:peptide chain release factor N(5)-glutamine methyltransferase [Dactylosporangium roseum]